MSSPRTDAEPRSTAPAAGQREQRTARSAQVTADRLGSTLFFAALAHGVLILGVTFTGGPSADTSPLPSLNVTLVVDTGEVQAPPDSDWLAQANVEGGGGAEEGLRPTTTLAAEQPLTAAGDPQASGAADGRPRKAASQAEEILTRAESVRRVEALPKATDTPAAELERQAALLDRTAPETLAAEIDEQARLPEADEDSQRAAPSARESILAAYLDAWRRRVERIGTLNFPVQLNGRQDFGRPTLEVAIDADGELADIVVRESSGDDALDQAALTILRLAAPFEPLPDAIKARYDVLRFAYEWDFAGGTAEATRAR